MGYTVDMTTTTHPTRDGRGTVTLRQTGNTWEVALLRGHDTVRVWPKIASYESARAQANAAWRNGATVNPMSLPCEGGKCGPSGTWSCSLHGAACQRRYGRAENE